MEYFRPHDHEPPQPSRYLPTPTYTGLSAAQYSLTEKETIEERSALPPPAHVGEEPIETYAKIGSAYAPAETETPAVPDDSTPPIEPPTKPPVPSPQPEEPQPPLDIRRSPTATLIVSTTHPDPELAERAAQAVSEGIPDTWQPIQPYGRSPGFLTDNLEEPAFFVKVVSTPVSRTYELEGAQYKDRLNPTHQFNGISLTAEARGEASISQEMRMAPEIQKILQDPKVQGMVKDHQFEDIQLIAPLVGGIDNQGRKFIVYPWRNGRSYPEDNIRDLPLRARLEAQHIKHVATKLERYFINNRIEPFDFDKGDIMATTDPSGKVHLHLFDITSFMRVRRQIH